MADITINPREHLEIIQKLSGAWLAVRCFYPQGSFPTMLKRPGAEMLNELLRLGAVDIDLQFTGSFKVVVDRIAEGRDLADFESADFAKIADAYADWYDPHTPPPLPPARVTGA